LGDFTSGVILTLWDFVFVWGRFVLAMLAIVIFVNFSPIFIFGLVFSLGFNHRVFVRKLFGLFVHKIFIVCVLHKVLVVVHKIFVVFVFVVVFDFGRVVVACAFILKVITFISIHSCDVLRDKRDVIVIVVAIAVDGGVPVDVVGIVLGVWVDAGSVGKGEAAGRAALVGELVDAVGTLPNGYVRSAPLPRLPNTRVPRGQITSTTSTCKPLRPTGRMYVPTYIPVAVWPHNNSIAIRANNTIGNRSNRLIIV
jgi:hypothetical protein